MNRVGNNYRKNWTMNLITNSRILVSLSSDNNRITVETKIKKKRVFIAADMIRLIAHYLPYEDMVNLVTIDKSVYAELVKNYRSGLFDITRKLIYNSKSKPNGKQVDLSAVRFVEISDRNDYDNKFPLPVRLSKYSLFQELRLYNCKLKYINAPPTLRVFSYNTKFWWGGRLTDSMRYLDINNSTLDGEITYPKLKILKCKRMEFCFDFENFPSIKYLDIELNHSCELENLDKLDHNMNCIKATATDGYTADYLKLLKNGEQIEYRKFHTGIRVVRFYRFRNVKINGYNINLVVLRKELLLSIK